MFKLLKGGTCYTPEYIGKNDILVVSDKIYKIENEIFTPPSFEMDVIDCTGKIICPGFIDQHVHITGGGGEQGPPSSIPEINADEVLISGVTTLVGLLGFDCIGKNLSGLLSKARALKEEGITAYIHTGSYCIPTPTLTGKISTDILYVNEILGVGEIAISDHRSSHPTREMLLEIASEARLGGLLGKKAGVLHIHVGEGKGGLSPLLDLVTHSDFPMDMFIPTHVNRNRLVFNQALEFCKEGGYVDLTAGESRPSGIPVDEALSILFENGCSHRMTVSSDGNGSIPSGKSENLAVGRMKQLYEDIRISILDRKLDTTMVLQAVTSNPAKALKLYPSKGVLSAGSDADILVLEKDHLRIDKLMALGKLLLDNGKPTKQ